MSNRFHGKYIIVDTTDTQVGGPTAASGPTGPLSILAIKWVSTQASGRDIANQDDLTIEYGKDGGDIVIACRAQLAAVTGSVVYSVEFSQPWVVSGLYFEDLDGGEVQIFLA